MNVLDRCRRTALTGSGIAVGLGLLTILGWTLGIEALASVRAKYIPMAPSTALAFTLLGLAMAANVLWPGRTIFKVFSNVAAGTVLALAGAKLFEFFTGNSLGIEERLVRTPEMFGKVSKGRMSPITAAEFLMSSMAILFLGRRAVGALAVIVAGVAAVVVLGYLSGTPLLYGATIIPVALPTALAFLCVSVSLITAAGSDVWPLRPMMGESTRALLLRAFLPVTVGLILLFGVLQTLLQARYVINPALVAAVSALVFAVVIATVISKVAARVGGRLERAEAELKDLNEQLEQRVAKRTRQLQEQNEQMTEDLRLAREMQLAMLPSQFPSLPPDSPATESALQFFRFYYPTGAVSGDFYDVRGLSDNSVGVFICDVMGHGVRAALVTAMMRALLEERSEATSDPGKLLTRLNRRLAGILSQSGDTIFATAFYLIADVHGGRIRFANAGHPAPLHVRRQQRAVAPLRSDGQHGPALGLFADATYPSCQCSMDPQDMVMLFTDGLFEVAGPNDEQFDQSQLLCAVQRHVELPPEQLLGKVLTEIREFSRQPDFVDDVCLVGMEVTHLL